MSAGLSFSVTAIHADDVGAQERRLLDVAATCPPDVVFHDLIRTSTHVVAVRVTGGPSPQVTQLAVAPPHVGAMLGSHPRELLWLLEEAGDLLVPGLIAGRHDDEVDIGGGEMRVLCGVDEMTQIVDEHLADEDFVAGSEPLTVEFLKWLRAHLAIAKAEQLPLVAHW